MTSDSQAKDAAAVLAGELRGCHAGDTLTAQAEGVFLAVDFDGITARMRERRAE